MPDLPGTDAHPHARAVLRSALPPDGSPSHAYLFHGPAGTGKGAVARELAAALLADGAPDPGNARDRVMSGAHPDFTWVAPSGAHEMLTGDIDEPVVAAAARTPFEAQKRVFVLERADTLIETAANKLLKTLEEPPPYAHLILLTSRLSEVLPTVVSRCQLVRFDPLGRGELARRLEARGVPPETAAASARLALGNVEQALELALADGPALRAAAEALARAVIEGEVASKPWAPLLAVRKERGDRVAAELEDRLESELDLVSRKDRKRLENDYAERTRRARRRAETGAIDLGLQLTGLWLRDLAAVNWGAQGEVHHSDRAGTLLLDAAGQDPDRLIEGVELVEETRRRLLLNVSEELALEALAYRLSSLLASA